MKNKDIVVVGLQSWDSEIGSNCKNIAMEFARQNRVLYVNRALDRVSKFRNRSDPKTQRRIQSLKGEIPSLEQALPNLWVLDPDVILESVNWMPGFLFRFFNKINNRRMARSITAACKALGFKKIVLFNDNDFFRAQHLPELLHAQYFIYYIRDYLINQDYFKKHGAELEISLIKKADIVVANSSYLANYAAKYNERSSDIGQGCDFTYFKPGSFYEEPEDLKNIPHPRIGYVGALVSYRLDIDLLVKMAKAKPEWNWVFVGPEDDAFRQSNLHEIKNVFFLGRKNEQELAGYVSHFDVCINPQLVNEITVGNYPRKVDEYLAMGKPVVATFTDFMKSFAGYVYLCTGADEYIRAINSALESAANGQLAEQRSSFALTHTWENSVKKIYDSAKFE